MSPREELRHLQRVRHRLQGLAGGRQGGARAGGADGGGGGGPPRRRHHVAAMLGVRLEDLFGKFVKVSWLFFFFLDSLTYLLSDFVETWEGVSWILSSSKSHV